MENRKEKGGSAEREGGRETEQRGQCGEQGNEAPSETNKKWNNNIRQKELLPLRPRPRSHTSLCTSECTSTITAASNTVLRTNP